MLYSDLVMMVQTIEATELTACFCSSGASAHNEILFHSSSWHIPLLVFIQKSETCRRHCRLCCEAPTCPKLAWKLPSVACQMKFGPLQMRGGGRVTTVLEIERSVSSVENSGVHPRFGQEGSWDDSKQEHLAALIHAVSANR